MEGVRQSTMLRLCYRLRVVIGSDRACMWIAIRVPGDTVRFRTGMGCRRSGRAKIYVAGFG